MHDLDGCSAGLVVFLSAACYLVRHFLVLNFPSQRPHHHQQQQSIQSGRFSNAVASGSSVQIGPTGVVCDAAGAAVAIIRARSAR